jgi:RING finger protein 121
MACKIGYFTHEGLPKKVLEANVCAICGDHLQHLSNHVATGDEDDADSGTEEKTFALSCNHIFHESCIRGWIVLGNLMLPHFLLYVLFRKAADLSVLQRKS